MMNSLDSYSKAYLSICLLGEVMLQELAVDWAKLEALSIDNLVGSICVNHIYDIRFLPFGSEFTLYLMGCEIWSS